MVRTLSPQESPGTAERAFFPVKHEKFPPPYIQDAKNFSVVKPLSSGEARANLFRGP